MRESATYILLGQFSGGADEAEHIAELLGRGLENLTDEELEELNTAIEARAVELAEASTAEQVAELQTLADNAEAVRAENTRRDEAAAELAETRDAAMARITPPAAEAEAETPETPAEETPAETTTTTTTTETETETPAETPAEAEAETPTPEQIAAASRPAPGAAAPARPAAARPRATPEAAVAPATIVAAGDVGRFGAGDELTLEEFGVAFAEKAHAIKGTRFKGKAQVASIHWEYPEERRLGSDPHHNRELIEAAVAEARAVNITALAAAGGLCAPVAVRYDIPVINSARRPIRDSALVRFGADRGGIRFQRPPILTDLDGSVAAWTEANDAAAAAEDFDPEAPGEGFIGEKPCIRIACGEEEEVVIDAITRCLTVGNFARRTFPEQFAAWWAIAEAFHARFAEDRLFARMAANSVAVTDQRQLGAAPDVFEALERLVAQYRSRHRTEENAVLRYVAPDWVRNFIVADIIRAHGLTGPDAFAFGASEVDRFFTAHGVMPTWTPDGDGQYFGPQTAGATLPWPGSFDALLYAEGSHIFVDGGELDLGTEIRDTTNMRTNDVAAFTETFENTAFVGVESLVITHNVCASGVRQAPAEVDVCTVGGGS